MNVEIKPYFAPGERYPALIGVRADGDEYETAYVSKSELVDAVRERDELRELVRGLHMAYVGALNECEGMDAGLIWDHCEMVDAELAKSHARFEVDRHRFDVAMRELGVVVVDE